MKVGRYLLLTLIGGIVGGCIVVLFDMSNQSNLLSRFHFNSNALILSITLVSTFINLMLTVLLFKYQKDSLHFKSKSLQLENEEIADTYERKANLRYLSSSFILYLEILISLITILILSLIHI